MDVITLSRLQFAIVTVYHFFFVPVTLGLSIFVAILSTMYLKTGKDSYKYLTKMFSKLFLINFAMGIVTGLVQEFQFGMNWAEYSRFMGDVFGAPLALEALMAFYLESIFIGVWIFGEGRLSEKWRCVAIWLVAFGSNLSAFWILTANAFMQHPVGYAINNGRAEMKSFFDLVTNPYLWGQFTHVLTAGISTAGMVVMAVCAYKLLVKENIDIYKKGLQVGAIYATIGVLAVSLSGHLHTRYVGFSQPMKLAAMEALWDTKDPAPFALYASIDATQEKNDFEIDVPDALSMLMYNKPSGEIKGIKQLQQEASLKYGNDNYIPNVNILFWSFRIMLACGGLMVLAALGTLFLWKTGRLSEYSNGWLKFLIFSAILPFLANSTGWILAENGRQPWIVYGLQKVSNSVSQNLTPMDTWITVIGFTLLYAVLIIVALGLAAKALKKDVTDERSGL